MLPISLFRVAGASMEPGLRERDLVVVETLSYLIRRPRAGEVVVARHPSTDVLIVKRIAEVQGQRYVLRGDNDRESSDSRVFGAVTRKMLVGRVLTVLRRT